MRGALQLLHHPDDARRVAQQASGTDRGRAVARGIERLSRGDADRRPYRRLRTRSRSSGDPGAILLEAAVVHDPTVLIRLGLARADGRAAVTGRLASTGRSGAGVSSAAAARERPGARPHADGPTARRLPAHRRLDSRISSRTRPSAPTSSSASRGIRERIRGALRVISNRVRLTTLHVFPYSDRPGTEATPWRGRSTGPCRANEAESFARSDQALTTRFKRSQVGTVRPRADDRGRQCRRHRQRAAAASLREPCDRRSSA